MRTPTLLLLTASGLAAQAANPLTDAFTAQFTVVRQNLIEAAQAMPENDYGFHLTPAQRSFGEWIGHTAIAVSNGCAAIEGSSAPDTSGVHELTTKAKLVQALQNAFATCDPVLNGLKDERALTPVTVNGKQQYPVRTMFAMVGGLNEHYGNLAGYLRSKGITPPSTARAAKTKTH